MPSSLPTTSAIAVIGAGTMGAGIVQVAAASGHDVYLYDNSGEATDRGIAGIAKFLARSVEKGRMSEDERSAALGRIHKAESLQDLAPAKLVIEAIIENLDIKRSLFAQLEDILDDDAILTSNTSSISITEIAAKLKRPERMVGMHFFNPAPLMKLVEVVKGLVSSDAVARCVFETATSWGKKAVYTKSTPGFIVNRVARPFYAEALRIAAEGGADMATIDACMRESGAFRMGPFELMDLIGNDINFSVTKSVYNAYFQDPRYRPSLIQQEQVAAGRFGRKSGHGYYDYSEDAPKPEILTADAVTSPIKEVNFLGTNEMLLPLVKLAEDAGIKVNHWPEEETNGFQIDSAFLLLSNGMTATELTRESGEQVVVFDLALDYATSTRIAVAKGDQVNDDTLDMMVAFLQSCGKKVSVIDDCPGLITMRLVAMLASEGADAVYQGVGTAQAVDVAMMNGVNYPKGPMAWAEIIGLDHIHDVLVSLSTFYGEERYRFPPLFRRHLNSGISLFNT
jgi:3-hydroxybutyryl-CoA dehydrogenase